MKYDRSYMWQNELFVTLSSRLDDVDAMISSAMGDDPNVQSLLTSSTDVWMPVITATSEEHESNGKIHIEL
ncbi:hypothetical protein Leryth_008158 [Lithospermum erythrorhizon]|nr:hypothetical protein Leryth_008158 [Lithospermum erythrorhizon]